MDIVERVARAIEAAQCPRREGPFGGYDYGYPDNKQVEGGRYVIRDFRDPKSPDWGKWLHQTDDCEEHERMFAEMTERHVARAALAAMLEAVGEPTQEMREAFVELALRVSLSREYTWGDYANDQWKVMLAASPLYSLAALREEV